ncbi:MAG: hypothetical protein R2688_08315 [Fimbriimonadaceae bacterium]
MSWDSVIQSIKPEMESRHAAREAALKANREIIQICSRSIKNVHRRDYDSAKSLLAQARELATSARRATDDHPGDQVRRIPARCRKRACRGGGVYCFGLGGTTPTADDLGVGPTSYLNGMGECASEMRRTVLDLMREGNFAEAERIHKLMEAIYDDLTEFDFPDGLTGGLRRTCDAPAPSSSAPEVISL